MRKVLVLAAALVVTATQALAAQSSVVGSKHDLSTTGPGTVKTTNYTEVCVFCHTPHTASTSTSLSPLWNRTTVTSASATTDLYNSSTLEAGSRPGAAGVLGNVQNSDAPLCFSCHDGSNVGSGLVNPANRHANAQPTFATTAMATGNLLDGANKLKNDHPIGMNYSAARTTDNGGTGLKDVSAAGITFYGTSSKIMWCSSCHDVHSDEFAPFLVKNNNQSGLCTTCHNK